MRAKSRALFVLLISVLLFVSCAAAQSETGCPTIDVTGPAGIARSGEFLRFTTTVSGASDALQITYAWTISSGKIVSGQGTRSIVVDNEDRAITATVDIGGLPADCPKSTSDYYGGDPSPTAEKLYEVPGHQALSELNIGFLTDTLRQHRSDQLYVIIHGKNDVSNWRHQNELSQALKAMGIPYDRITMVTVFWEPSVTQFWRIPPGAVNPEPGQFEGRKKDSRSCPTISITPPAGITQPGESMTFVAKLRGDVPANLLYVWTITHAKIIDGQGTLRITAQKEDAGASWPNPVATLTVKGLPKGCPNSASEADPTVVDPGPIQLGEINNSSYTIDRELLVTIGKEMRANANSQLYVWIYSNQSERQVEKIKSHVLRQLSTTKIDPSRFTLNTSPERTRGVVFWQILPGVWNPAP